MNELATLTGWSVADNSSYLTGFAKKIKKPSRDSNDWIENDFKNGTLGLLIGNKDNSGLGGNMLLLIGIILTGVLLLKNRFTIKKVN